MNRSPPRQDFEPIFQAGVVDSDAPEPLDWAGHLGRSLDEAIVALWQQGARRYVTENGVFARWRRLMIGRQEHPALRPLAAAPPGLLGLVTGRWWSAIDSGGLTAESVPEALDPLRRYATPARLRSLGLVGTREGRLWSIAVREFADSRPAILRDAIGPLADALATGALVLTAIAPLDLQSPAAGTRMAIPHEWFRYRHWRVISGENCSAALVFIPPAGHPEIFEGPILSEPVAPADRTRNTEPTPATIAPRNSRGPRPKLMENIISKMVADYAGKLSVLAGEKQDIIANRYGVSRGTAQKARDEALKRIAPNPTLDD